MSAMALAWVAKIKVGNQTAKQLLQFYACHNFNTNEYVFKNSTLSNQLEVTERAIQYAHKLLLEQNLIVRKKRFDENGREKSSETCLNIPQEFIDRYFDEHMEGDLRAGGRVNDDHGGDDRSAPLLNNNFNNKEGIRTIGVKKRTPATKFPDDFEFTEEQQQICIEFDLDINFQLRKYKNRYKNKRKSDWSDKFTSWLLTAAEYKKDRLNNSNHSGLNKNDKLQIRSILSESCQDSVRQLREETCSSGYTLIPQMD